MLRCWNQNELGAGRSRVKYFLVKVNLKTRRSAYLLLLRRRELSGRRTSDGHDGARQGDVGQPSLLDPAAVVGDLERTPFVVVQTTSWGGENHFKCCVILFLFYCWKAFWFVVSDRSVCGAGTVTIIMNWQSKRWHWNISIWKSSNSTKQKLQWKIKHKLFYFILIFLGVLMCFQLQHN